MLAPAFGRGEDRDSNPPLSPFKKGGILIDPDPPPEGRTIWYTPRGEGIFLFVEIIFSKNGGVISFAIKVVAIWLSLLGVRKRLSISPLVDDIVEKEEGSSKLDHYSS